jgi:hypothetical protein
MQRSTADVVDSRVTLLLPLVLLVVGLALVLLISSGPPG